MVRYTTYTTLDGEVLDLSGLAEQERAHFDRAYEAFKAGIPYVEFGNRFVYGHENPVVRTAGGWVTRAVWGHPLCQAVRDLHDRLGIQQGEIGAEPGDEVDRDPVADEWVPVAEAAARKGVTVSGLHQAIKRGDVLARPKEPGSARLLVSRNSLAHWAPAAVRQRAARQVRTRVGGRPRRQAS